MKTIDIMPGERIDRAIRRCIQVAKNSGETTSAMFNGTPIVAEPGEDFDAVDTRYWRERKRIQDRKAAR